MCSRQYNRKYKASIFSILQVLEGEKLAWFTPCRGARYDLFLLASIVLSYVVLCNAISFITISSSKASFPSFLLCFLPSLPSFLIQLEYCKWFAPKLIWRITFLAGNYVRKTQINRNQNLFYSTVSLIIKLHIDLNIHLSIKCLLMSYPRL